MPGSGETVRSPAETAQTVRRALQILDVLALAGEPLGVSEIARRVGAHKSSVYRVMRTMVECDYLEQNHATSKYWLGPQLYSVGMAASYHMELPRLARPHVERLSQVTRESVNFVKLHDDRCVYLVSVTGSESIGRFARAGGSSDAIYSTALGKSMLAFMPRRLAEAILERTEFVRHTPQTAKGPADVLAQLPVIAKRGYAIDDRENEPDVACVGAPVFDRSARVTGAVSVSGPAYRLTAERLESIAPAVVRCAIDIAEALGLPPERNPLTPLSSR